MCLVADDSGTSVDPHMPAHYRLGPRYLYGPASAGPVHRQRDPRRARLRTRQHQPQAAHQGRVPPRDLRARPDGGPTRRPRHQGGAALPATWCRRGGSVTLRLRFTDQATPRCARHVDSDHRRAAGRGRRVLFRSGPARGHRRREARAAPRAGGAPVEQAELPVRRGALARRR